MKHHHSSLSREEREKRRLKAATLFKKDVPQAEIARRFGISTAAASYWYAAYKKGGKAALRSKGQTGFSSKLTPKKRLLFKKAILKGPLSYGYETNLWTLPRLSAVMKKVAGVKFSDVWTWQIVRDLGFTPQKPQVKAAQRDESAIAEWKAKTLPGLKKMGTNTWVSSGV